MSFIIIRARIIQPCLKPTTRKILRTKRELCKGTKLRDIMYGALSLLTKFVNIPFTHLRTGLTVPSFGPIL